MVLWKGRPKAAPLVFLALAPNRVLSKAILDAMLTRAAPAFLREVRIRNYKSIGKCAVSFRPVTLLVGRNGSGKSNFLDALRFVTEGLQSSLDHAIRTRGGIDNVRRKSTGHPRNFAIELDIALT